MPLGALMVKDMRQTRVNYENDSSMEEYKMSMKDIEKMKKFIEEKKSKTSYFQAEKKIGSGEVEKRNKNIGLDSTRTKKISQ